MSRHTLQMLLRRFVLACYLGAVGAAIASPIFFPQQTSVVCSAGERAKFVVQSDDGSESAAHGLLDCPLCLASTAPAALHTVAASFAPPQARSTFLGAAPAPVLPAPTAPLPPRGPPQVC